MKAKLIKTNVNYLLEDDKGVIIASTSTKDVNNKLSKQNCDEIFSSLVVDVEKFVKEHWENDKELNNPSSFKAGFNKAMELNKDKLFTLEDMMNCWNKSLKFQEHKQTLGEYIQSLQQPTEIEVEIVTVPALSNNGNVYYGDIPKIDSSGCLILKKI
jgi:hypothetical protein